MLAKDSLRSIEIVRFSVVLAFSTVLSFGQAVSAQATSNAPACAHLAQIPISVNTTVETEVDGLDSRHMKPGKDVWFKVAHGVVFPGCTLDEDAVVYARILSVKSTKNPDSSDVSLAFDRADCNGKEKRPFKLRLIAVVGPPDPTKGLHNATPTEVDGGPRQMDSQMGSREIDSALVGTNSLDLDLNPGGPANTVRPGIVLGVKNVKLDPTGGTDCSDKLSSTKSKIQIESGSELILAMTETK